MLLQYPVQLRFLMPQSICRLESREDRCVDFVLRVVDRWIYFGEHMRTNPRGYQRLASYEEVERIVRKALTLRGRESA